MIFQHTVDQVLDGTKTQTRRLVKPGDAFATDHSWKITVPTVWNMVVYSEERPRWRIGNDYAVQPGRGQKSVGRIRITAIRRERIGDIMLSREDMFAELGLQFYTNAATRTLTVNMHSLWDSIHTKPGTRWEDNPEVWVLTFEVAD